MIDIGLLNFDFGFDFFNVKLKIGGMFWVGNVEIYIVFFDWFCYGYDCDIVYDLVILYIVIEIDCEIYCFNGELVL